MWSILKCVTFAALISVCAGALPFNIDPCKRENFECMKNEANKVIYTIVHGNHSVKLPSFNPLVLPKAEILGNGGLKITFTDLSIKGLDTLKITALKIDFDKNTADFEFDANLELYGPYKSSGHVIIFEVSGNGNSNMTLVDVKGHVHIDYVLENRKGQEYLKIVKNIAEIKPKKAYFDFENVLPDERLSKNANELFNQEWEAILEDVKGGVNEIVIQIVNLGTSAVLNRVPFAKLFQN